MQQDTPKFNDLNKQLLKFHGTYQQEDRDARKARRAEGLGKHYMFMVRCKIPGGRVLADAMSDRDELEAIGTEGSLFLDDPWHCRKPVIELRREGTVERIELEPVDSYRLELENLSDAIRGRGDPLLGRTDALAQARTIEALFRSQEANEPVALS